MKKNLVVGMLALVSLLSLTFGYYEKVRADKLEENLSKELLMKEAINKNSEDVMQQMQQKVDAQKQKDSLAKCK